MTLVILVPSITMLSLGLSFSVVGCFFLLYTALSVSLGCLVLTLKDSDVKDIFSFRRHHVSGAFQSNIILPQNTLWTETEWFEHPLQPKPIPF